MRRINLTITAILKIIKMVTLIFLKFVLVNDFNRPLKMYWQESGFLKDAPWEHGVLPDSLRQRNVPDNNLGYLIKVKKQVAV